MIERARVAASLVHRTFAIEASVIVQSLPVTPAMVESARAAIWMTGNTRR